MKMPATLLCDFYKISHKNQYPKGTQKVYSTWIPRSDRYSLTKDGKIIALGFQGVVKKWLIDYFNENFFSRPEKEVKREYERYLKHCLGVENPDSSHIIDLHKYGKIPVNIYSVEEGLVLPIGTPMLTIENTESRFFWVTNYLETLLSSEMWKPSTSITIANAYMDILNRYADLTCEDRSFVPYQGHDFSMRGMGLFDGASSGFGHLARGFVGSDTITAIMYAEEYYNSNIEKELIGCSVNATEHSVMSAGGKGTEFDTYKRLMTEVHPTGILSIVSDTWDLWKVISDIIKPLKNDILARDGKIVIRPDSGDPVDIICGKQAGDWVDSINERKGVIELLWDIFGGTVNSKGYKELDSHIGAIYGDAITLERAEQICRRLEAKGFASNNIVFGIGSFTYQYNTRDTYGFAMKATYVVINGEEKFITKDPVTDDGTKKSLTGLVSVHEEIQKDGSKVIKTFDGLNREQYNLNQKLNLLKPLFIDGVLVRETSLREIRERLL